MRSGSWCLLWVVLSVSVSAFAEETSSVGTAAPLPPSANGQMTDAQQRPKVSDQQRDEMSRLRQENQRLKLQLKESQAASLQGLFTEQQQWFVAGGGVATIALLCGIFATGWRRQRRQWLN
jgi:SH3 domain protein